MKEALEVLVNRLTAAEEADEANTENVSGSQSRKSNL